MNGKTFLAVTIILLGVILVYAGVTGRTRRVMEAIKS